MEPANFNTSAMPAKKRSLGQNFLKNTEIARRIVESASISHEDKVLEIGPGAGALTGFIAEKKPAALLLLEKDYYWASFHGHRSKNYDFSCLAVLIDALNFKWEKLAEKFPEKLPEKQGANSSLTPWKIMGNLPYNVASPLIWEIVHRAKFCSCVFMVQKEVAQRMASDAGSREYGALSVWLQSFTRVTKLFVVSPGAFDPSPKVDSMVVKLEPLNTPLKCSPQKLSELLKICFQKRRKQLKGILKEVWSADVENFLIEHGHSAEVRPERLTPLQFQELAAIIC